MIMSFILSKFVATEEEFLFWHPGYGVFLQTTILAMAFEYMTTILAIHFWKRWQIWLFNDK